MAGGPSPPQRQGRNGMAIAQLCVPPQGLLVSLVTRPAARRHALRWTGTALPDRSLPYSTNSPDPAQHSCTAGPQERSMFKIMKAFSLAIAMAFAAGTPALRTGQIHHRVRRRLDEERARRHQRRLHQGDRHQGRGELCGELRAGEADRAGRAGRRLRLRRPRMDGLRLAEEAHQGRHAASTCSATGWC